MITSQPACNLLALPLIPVHIGLLSIIGSTAPQTIISEHPPEFRLLNPSASEIQKEHPHKYISKHMFEEPRKGRRKPPGGII